MNRFAGPGAKRKRVLFVGEAVTLAHVARPAALAAALDADRFDIHFAADPRFDRLIDGRDWTRHALFSVSPAEFLRALGSGRPLYRLDTLETYVDADLRLIRAVEPDIIVGDFRLSLAVSAPVANVPYAALINAYWSPYVAVHYRAPELPWVRFVPVTVADTVFRAARPIAFRHHAGPLNSLRRSYGFPPFGSDLRAAYSHADYALYPDIPQLMPAQDLPHSHRYLGPILWSPEISFPSWWRSWPEDKPVVYVNLGSSGPVELLDVLVTALAELPVTVLVATAGRLRYQSPLRNVLVADFLPGDAAVALSKLVLCNGGSPATQQALMEGVPVLAFPCNLDQILNMNGIVEAGAGVSIRPSRADVRVVRRFAQEMLNDLDYTRAAGRLSQCLRQYDAAARFRAFIDEVL